MCLARENLKRFMSKLPEDQINENPDLGLAWTFQFGKRADDSEYVLLVAFGGKRGRPDVYEAHRNLDNAGRRFQEWIERQKHYATLAAEGKIAKAMARKVNPFKVGDLLHCSWGYDQTQNEFYQVIAVKGQTVTIREIGASYKADGYMSGMSTPIKDKFIGSEIVKRVVASAWPGHEPSYYVKISDCIRLHKTEWGKGWSETSYA